MAIPPTPGNWEQVTEIEKLISLFQHQILDLLNLTLQNKTLKAARLTKADRVALNFTNTELLTANTQKKKRVQCTRIQYNGQDAYVLSLKDIEERRQLTENKKKDKEAKKLVQKERQANSHFLQVSINLMRLGPHLIFRPNPLISSKNIKNPGSSGRNEKYGNHALINAFQVCLWIEPDLFEELVLDDLVSHTLIQSKDKGVPRRKNITWPVHVGLGTMEEEKEENILKVQISLRGGIIWNTRKI